MFCVDVTEVCTVLNVYILTWGVTIVCNELNLLFYFLFIRTPRQIRPAPQPVSVEVCTLTPVTVLEYAGPASPVMVVCHGLVEYAQQLGRIKEMNKIKYLHKKY